MKKEKKPRKARKVILIILIILIAFIVLVMLVPTSDEDDMENTLSISEKETEESVESHIYDNAEIVDMMNGSQTEVIGEVSIIETESADVSLDVLEDWYFNYVSDSEYNYYLILYTDMENTGCYAISGMVETNVTLEPNSDGTYSLSDTSNETMYIPSDGELVEYGTEE